MRARLVPSYPVSARSDWYRGQFRSGQASQLKRDSFRDGPFESPPDSIVDTPFIPGFLAIVSKQPLNVVARYSASGQGEVSSRVVAVERTKMRVRADRFRGVEICHVPPGDPGNEHRIIIDEAAVGTHLAHGDCLGGCESDGAYDED